MRYFTHIFLVAMLSGCGTMDLDNIKDLILESKPEPAVERIGGDELLAQIEAVAVERTENTPDIVDVEMRTDTGDVVAFQIRNKAEVWLGGNGYHANDALRHRILAVIGEDNARNLGGNHTRRGEPAMPPVNIEGADIYYWTTANGKRMYEINNVSLYAIRVVERLKAEIGVTGTIIEVTGTIRRYR